jgi:hypothetical protein
MRLTGHLLLALAVARAARGKVGHPDRSSS